MQFWLMWASAAIWLAFMVFWNIRAASAAPAAAGTKPGRWISVRVQRVPAPRQAEAGATRESSGSRSMHQLLLWAALLIALLPGIPPLNHRWLPAEPWVAPAGLVVQAAFGLLYAWSFRHLGRNWSGAIRTTPEQSLVRTGPYRLLRHPMYTAMVGMLLGTAIISGQWHGLLGAAICAAAYWRKIRIEEPHLERKFGAEYEAYRRSSWALIPGLV